MKREISNLELLQTLMPNVCEFHGINPNNINACLRLAKQLTDEEHGPYFDNKEIIVPKSKECIYCKGTDALDRLSIYVIYAESKRGVFDNIVYTVEKFCVNKSGTTRYATVEDAQKNGEWFRREISETEYNIYYDLQILATEFYMHDFTDGFPNINNVVSSQRHLKHNIEKIITKITGDICKK